MNANQFNIHVCPWWLAYIFDNPLRRLLHNPEKLLAGLVEEGQTAVDIGCGMGHFSPGMARMVGENGWVISVDLQEKMLDRVRSRAVQSGLESRIRLHQCQPNRIDVSGLVDFVLAFWMVHEVSNQQAFLAEVRNLLKPEARFLLVEPKIHVTASSFQKTVDIARATGMKPCMEPKVRMSRAVLFASGKLEV
jgi:ubiquinone/menaquinone biosynthesis C-methylase UbiE